MSQDFSIKSGSLLGSVSLEWLQSDSPSYSLPPLTLPGGRLQSHLKAVGEITVIQEAVMVQKGCWAQTPALWHIRDWALFPGGHVTVYTCDNVYFWSCPWRGHCSYFNALDHGLKDSRVNTICCHRAVTNWGLLIPAVLLTAFHKLTAFRKDSYSLKDAFILTLGSIHFELAAVLPTTELKNHCFYFCMRFVAADSLLIRYCLKFQPQEGIIISGLLKVYIPMTT